MNKIIVLPVITAVIVGIVAFVAGMKYQESKATTSQNQFAAGRGFGMGPGMGANGQARAGGMGGAVVGEILSLDDKSITVKLPDGSSKIVLLSDNVTVSKTDTGSKTDLKVGERVGVFGSSNSDGSLTAQNIQLNPMFRIGGGRNSGSPRPSGSAK